jgi:hypothetical protein
MVKEQSWPIPVHLVRKEKIDLESETLSTLGASVSVGFKLLAKPLSFGVMSLLEIMDNKLLKMLFTGDESIEPETEDLWTVYYVNHHRSDCLEDVRRWFRGDKDPLEKKIAKFGKKRKILDHHFNYVIEMLERAHLGFKMIPQGKGGGGDMLYGAEAQANICYCCCNHLGIDHKKAVWETPLSLIGHTVALKASENGVKGVERPDDVKHLEEFKRICMECDERHELYPWQKERPFWRGIFQWQHEDVVKKWIDAANEYIEKNGPEPNKDKAEIQRVREMYKSLRKQYKKELSKKGD